MPRLCTTRGLSSMLAAAVIACGTEAEKGQGSTGSAGEATGGAWTHDDDSLSSGGQGTGGRVWSGGRSGDITGSTGGSAAGSESVSSGGSMTRSGGAGGATGGAPQARVGGSGGSTIDSTGTLTTTGGTEASGGIVGSGTWRPFAEDSPWNTPVPDNATLHPDSDELIADWATSSPSGVLGVSIPGYAIPLYWADDSTPVHTVTCAIGGEGFESDDGFDATVQMPIPNGAVPDPESDAHPLVVDRERHLEWGLYGARQQGDRWSCELGAMSDLSGSGVRPQKQGNPVWYTSHGARACGFPLVAGLMRLEEIEAGRIEHALVVAYPVVAKNSS